MTEPPTLRMLLESLPSYARDLRINLRAALSPNDLTPRQLWGTAVASAAAARHRRLLEAIQVEAGRILEPRTMDAALSASAVMGMNNVYFRFLELVGDETYSEMRSGLRMNIVRSHGIPGVDFDLWCLAASAINGCGKCVQAHERAARQAGVRREAVLAAVRIAGVIQAVAGVLENREGDRLRGDV